MNNAEPTQEQLKKFWEWCGFKWIIDIHSNYWSETQDYSHWKNPDGKDCKFPDITLDNLFKYAVPKLVRYKLECADMMNKTHRATFWTGATTYVEVDSNKPELALFWAIYSVIK